MGDNHGTTPWAVRIKDEDLQFLKKYCGDRSDNIASFIRRTVAEKVIELKNNGHK